MRLILITGLVPLKTSARVFVYKGDFFFYQPSKPRRRIQPFGCADLLTAINQCAAIVQLLGS